MMHKICLAAAFFCIQVFAGDVPVAKRDPWLWPFERHSIWNMPIGSGATYKHAQFEASGHVGVDIQHILKLDASDPLRRAFQTSTFGAGRCSATVPHDIWLPIPDDWIVADAANSPYGDTPNSNFAFLLPESDTVFEGSVISRCVAGGPFYLPEFMKWPQNRSYQSIRGDGLQGGGQGASGMSALGGTIRLGELIDDNPIRHAIKINPWAEKYCHYSDSVPGYKWPAASADSYASIIYNPNADPDIVMGSLFAIPPSVSQESLNLETVAGKKLFFTLQNYGAYFTEDAAWDTWDLIVQRGVEQEFEDVYGFSMSSSTWHSELNKLMQTLHVVTNNTAESIGGGATPLQPLAPDFQEPGTKTVRPWHPKPNANRPDRQTGTSIVYYSINGRRINNSNNQRGATSVILTHSACARAKILLRENDRTEKK